MGCFSWIDAVSSHPIWYGNSANVRLLIPKEFGGGAYEGHFDGYGNVWGTDVYDVAADWNRAFCLEHPDFKPRRSPRISDLRWYDAYVHAESREEFEKKTGIEWREVGIAIACHDEDNARLRYPIKLTTDPAAVYEEVSWSLSDPWQGCTPASPATVRKLAAYRASVDRAAKKAGLTRDPVPRMKYCF